MSAGLKRTPTAQHSEATAALRATEFLLYQTEDGAARVEVRMDDETVWLSAAQLSDLFGRDKSVISRHIKNIFDEGELSRRSVVANFATTASDGKTYRVEHFNLDAIISVGYRVKSQRGVQFRIWATQRLREFLVKGFAMDDDRLKAAGDGRYFDELLARIRDIRSSEKMFWRKVLEIYATSIDYDPQASESQQFFATIQNKMHWAAHGHTAAELIATRANASSPNMGLTTWVGVRPRKADVEVAKNYLNAEELDVLNRIVSFYLEFAELQALNRKSMTMQAWVQKLDDFLRISERDILMHAGRVSNDSALRKAHLQYEQFRQAQLNAPSAVERHFAEATDKTKRLVKAVEGSRNDR